MRRPPLPPRIVSHVPTYRTIRALVPTDARSRFNRYEPAMTIATAANAFTPPPNTVTPTPKTVTPTPNTVMPFPERVIIITMAVINIAELDIHVAELPIDNAELATSNAKHKLSFKVAVEM